MADCHGEENDKIIGATASTNTGSDSQFLQRGWGETQRKTMFVRGFNKFDGNDQILYYLEEHFGGCGKIMRVSTPIDKEVDVKGIVYIDSKEGDAFNMAWELIGSQPEQRFGGAVGVRSKVQKEMLLKENEKIEMELRVLPPKPRSGDFFAALTSFSHLEDKVDFNRRGVDRDSDTPPTAASHEPRITTETSSPAAETIEPRDQAQAVAASARPKRKKTCPARYKDYSSK